MDKQIKLKFTPCTKQMPNKGGSKDEENGIDGDKRTNSKKK